MSPRAPPATACRSAALARAGASARPRPPRARPTISPACGPPSSLSPEQQTSAAPAATESATAGSSAAGIASRQPPRTDVVDHRHPQLAQRRDRDLLDEPDRPEVRLVHAHDRADVLVRSQRSLVVSDPRAVGSPDLDHPRPRLGDHLGDPEATADLDELPARHDDRPARTGERGRRQQHRGGAVVDDDRRLGAGELAQQPLDMGVAAAPLARGEVELEVGSSHRRPAPPPRVRWPPAARARGWCAGSRRWR